MGTWTTLERPGYFGSLRDARHAEYDRRYGKHGWRLAWSVGHAVFSREEALMLYEDAYYFYLADHAEMLDQLARDARDVYDDDPRDVDSGLDYEVQTTTRNHYQDIAIRRVMARHGRRFEGAHLVQIRHTEGTHPLSIPLSPGAVPFHQPTWIVQPALERWWWEPYSVECFYQSNKVLQVQLRDRPGLPDVVSDG